MPTSTITGAWSTFKNATHGPWLMPDGALYILLPRYTVGSTTYSPRIEKSTDGGATWSTAATISSSNGTTVAGAVSGSLIHIAYVSGTTLSYMRFDTSNTSASAVLGTATVANGITGTPQFAIAARSNGDAAILYQSATSSVMGQPYRRISVANYIGSTWTTSAYTHSNAVHNDALAIVTGANNLIHVFITVSGFNEIYHRTVKTDGTWGNSGLNQTIAGSVSAASSYPSGIPASNGASIVVPSFTLGGGLHTAVASSAEAPAWTTGTVSTSSPEATNSNPASISHDGTNYHIAWVSDDQTTIYTSTSSNGTTWSTPATRVSGATAIQGVNTLATTGDLFVLYDNNGTITLDYPGASGPVTLNASGSTAGTSTVAATAKLALTASASSAGTSSVTGAATQGTTLTASGTSAGTSTVTGNATQGATFTASATSAGTSTVAATAVHAVKGTGTSAGTSTVAGAVNATATLSATSAGTSTVVANTTMATVLLASGTSAGTSTVTGSATQGQTLLSSGTSTGGSTVSGAANLTAKLAGTSAGLSTVAANTTLATRLLTSATSAGAGSVTGSAKMAATASGVATGTSTVTGSASTGQVLVASATSAGISTATATATAGITATGSSAGTSTVAGTAKLAAMLTATSAGTSAVTGDAFTSATLPASGASAGTSTVTGAAKLTVKSAGTSAGTSTATGALDAATSFVHDTFTDTDNTLLTAHTGEIGATWSGVAANVPTPKIVSNRATDSGTTAIAANTILASGVPSSSEYDVEGDIFASSTSAAAIRLLARANTADYAAYHFYMSYAGSVILQRFTEAGEAVALASGSVSAVTLGAHYVIKGEIRDATKKMYVDGVEILSATDNTITAAGLVGIRMQAGWYLQFDSITATNAPITLQATGTTAGTSTVSATVAFTAKLAGTSAGTSTVTGQTKLAAKIAGTSAGTSTVSGNATLGQTLVASATSDGTSTVAATTKATATASGTSAGTSTVTGSAKIVLTATGSAAGTSSVGQADAGTLTASGTAQGSSSAAAVARMGLLVAASATGGSVVDEPYAVLAMVTSGSAAGVATCAGLVTGARRFWTTAQLVE